jgi:hypothetical protein
MTFARFALYAAVGFIELWFLGFMWGPADATSYFAVVGCLMLLLLAAPLALLVDRVAAIVALLGALLACAWAVAAVGEISVLGVILFGGLTSAACVVSVTHLWESRDRAWLSAPPSPRLAARIGLALLPLVVFATVFNPRLVFALVLAGPPQ